MKEKDQRLEQLLGRMRKAQMNKPYGLAANTIERMHAASANQRGKGQRWNNVKKNTGIIVAASIFILVGVLSAWGTLSWWVSRGNSDGLAVGFAQDYRIVQIQEQLPFKLALPDWLPNGFSLKEAKVSSTDSYEDLVVSLRFDGPKGIEPIILSQGYKSDLTRPTNITKFQTVVLSSPPLKGNGMVTSGNSSGGGVWKKSGFYYEIEFDGTFQHRALTFHSHEEPVFITISSGSSNSQSRIPADIADTDVFLNIAKGITGAETAELQPPLPIEEMPKSLGLYSSAYIPHGYKLTGITLVNILTNPIPYTGRLIYTDDELNTIIIQQWLDPLSLVADEAELVEYSTAQGSVIGYYKNEEEISKLTLMFDEIDYWVYIEIFSDSVRAGRSELDKIAQSLANQFSSLLSP